MLTDIKLQRKDPNWKIITLLYIVVVMIIMCVFGFKSKIPMIGDEVTYYGLVVKQSLNLAYLNFYSIIPVDYSTIPILKQINYQTVGWSYLGGIIYRFFPYFRTIEAYQLFYFFIFLLAVFSLGYEVSKSYFKSFLYLVILSSIPMYSLFGMIFYPDVPCTAMILLSFYFLIRNRFLAFMLFWIFALFLKDNSILFFPAIFISLFFITLREKKSKRLLKFLLLISGTVLTVLLLEFSIYESTGTHEYTINTAIHLYEIFVKPSTTSSEQKLTSSEQKLTSSEQKLTSSEQKLTSSEQKLTSSEQKLTSSEQKLTSSGEEITNYPGTPLYLKNWVIYLGGVFWIIILIGIYRLLKFRTKYLNCLFNNKNKTVLLFMLSYFLPAVFLLSLSNALDFRYFIPCFPFFIWILIDIVTVADMHLIVTIGLVSLCLCQGIFVLHRVNSMRLPSSDLNEAVSFLQRYKRIYAYDKIFMYPEGNFRFFPFESIWTQDGFARSFWLNNEQNRLKLCKKNRISFIVVKKYMIKNISPYDSALSSGCYPKSVVDSLIKDSKEWKVVFNNSSFLIFHPLYKTR